MKPAILSHPRLALIGLVLVLLLGLLLAPAAGHAQAAPAGGAAASAPPAASAPVLVIRGLRVVSGATLAARPAASAADRPGPGLQGVATAASQPAGLAAAALPTSTREASKTLTSAGGDLEVTVTADSYALATRYRAASQPQPELLLFLNGFNMAPPVATLFAQENAADGQSVHLRYHLDSNADAQGFWSAVYREHGLARPSDLHVELGWAATGPNSRIDRADRSTALAVAVAPDLRRWLAVAMWLAMLGLMLFLIRRTDTFRDAVPAWLATARHWQEPFNRADAAARLGILRQIDAAYDEAASRRAADDLLAGGEVAPIGVAATAAAATAVAANPANPAAASGPPMLAAPAVACGLLLRGQALPRPPYSLCRLQLGLWFGFVVGTGLLLWIAYGYLPAISGSVLALLGISVGTAVAAINVEPAAAHAGSNISQSLLVDVVTGFDQSQQLHRYQSVVVNGLLLLVGLQTVWTDLSFPVFDNTWLGFLGVSGAALAAGKQWVETPAAESRGAVAVAVAAAKAGG